MEDVTFIILTKNEEINLPDCLMSIKGFAKRIIVVDSGSNDKTLSIAKSFGCDIFNHAFEYHAKQFNWALENCNIATKWVFKLDADERITPNLILELSRLIKEHGSDDINGVTMEADLYFMGKRIKHGGSQKRKLMLFKTGIGYVEDRKMDEHIVLNSGKSISAKNKFVHYDFKDLTTWINKMNWYATREMQEYFAYKKGKATHIGANDDKEISKTRKKKFGLYYKFPLFIRCWIVFVIFYFFHLGFLDGKEGFVYHWMYHRWYRTLVDSKILEQRKSNKPFEELEDLK